jgi:hypothetical protein
VITNIAVLGGLEDGDAGTDDIRRSLAELIEGMGFERVNVVTGEVGGLGAFLVVDATSGYSTEENQLEAVIDGVYTMSQALWAPDFFGAATPEGALVVGLKLTSDNRSFTLSPEEMIAIRDRQTSASQALGLS